MAWKAGSSEFVGGLPLHGHEIGLEHGLPFLEVGQGLGPSLALDKELHPTPDPMGLDDPDDGPDLVENVGMGIVYVFTLGYGKEAPVSLQGLLNRLHRAGPAGRNGNGHAWVNHRVP
jgi:hypothetical protein